MTVVLAVVLESQLLCRPFEGHITSGLQTVLHYNPDMWGGRRVATEDAPCLTNMDHILNTQVNSFLLFALSYFHLSLLPSLPSHCLPLSLPPPLSFHPPSSPAPPSPPSLLLLLPLFQPSSLSSSSSSLSSSSSFPLSSFPPPPSSPPPSPSPPSLFDFYCFPGLQMVNAVCTSTRDVNSFVITNSSVTYVCIYRIPSSLLSTPSLPLLPPSLPRSLLSLL